MPRRSFIIILCFISATCWADEIRISLNPDSFIILPGVPIEFSLAVTNVSPADLEIAGTDLSHAVQIKSILIGTDGQPRDCYSDSSAPAAPNLGTRFMLAKGQTISMPSWISRHSSCALAAIPAGTYRGEISLSLYAVEADKLRGLSATTIASVKIMEPAGEDLAYLRDLEQAISTRDPKNARGGTLQQRPLEWSEVLHTYRAKAESLCLAKHPTSTYAALVIYGSMKWAGDWEPTERNKSLFVGSLETGSFLSNSYPDDTGQSKDGWRSMKGEEAAKWWDKWITIILKNHPDIWFADELRLRRALNQVALKKYDAGAADLKTLARDAKEPVASRARLIIDLIQEKGWIKPEASPPPPPPLPTPKRPAPASTTSPAPTKPPVGGS